MTEHDRTVETGQKQAPTKIGVLVVHGIGEQRRFEHLDGQVRDIVKALSERRDTKSTVDIVSDKAATFRAEQDTWAAGATVRVAVHDSAANQDLHICFHEVWWADVNEPYSLSKQMRFWFWGLGMWWYPKMVSSNLPTSDNVFVPRAEKDFDVFAKRWAVRASLFGVACVAVVGAASVGILTFLAQRVLDLQPPHFVRVFVNYLSCVKLYNQKQRRGAGLGSPEDFLDNLDEPPRVSVRRRMIRELMDMADRDYERWYVFAHSLGSVIAYNGLMETAYAWPGYFDEERWKEASLKKFAGDASPKWTTPEKKVGMKDETMPKRPVWAAPRAIAFRKKIFANFRGLLTFGSPLEKYAAIWPARVPISREPAFHEDARWFNIYDPVDPVSGVLRSYDDTQDDCSPKPLNKGYAAGPVLLANHLQYLASKKNGLPGKLVDWLITGEPGGLSNATGAPWFTPGSTTHQWRTLGAAFWWVGVTLILIALGVWLLPIMVGAAAGFFSPVTSGIGGVLGWIVQFISPVTTAIGAAFGGIVQMIGLDALLRAVTSWIMVLFTWKTGGDIATFLHNATLLASSAIALTLFVGILTRLGVVGKDNDTRGPDNAKAVTLLGRLGSIKLIDIGSIKPFDRLYSLTALSGPRASKREVLLGFPSAARKVSVDHAKKFSPVPSPEPD